MSNISSIFKEKSKFTLRFCCSCFLATKENVAENDANKTKLRRDVEIHRNFGYNSNSYKQQKQLQPASDTILGGIHFIEEEKM